MVRLFCAGIILLGLSATVHHPAYIRLYACSGPIPLPCRQLPLPSASPSTIVTLFNKIQETRQPSVLHLMPHGFHLPPYPLHPIPSTLSYTSSLTPYNGKSPFTGAFVNKFYVDLLGPAYNRTNHQLCSDIISTKQ